MRTEVVGAMNESAGAMLAARAKAAELNAELKAAQGSASSFGDSLGMIKQGLGAMGLAVSIGEVIQFGKATAEAAASIAHESSVLGLSTTALQAFHQAAIDSGSSTDAADLAIGKFNKAMGDAQIGVGQGAKAFAELGVSSHQSMAAALAQVSAMLLLRDTVTQNRLAVDLFSKSGREMIPNLQLWAMGVDQLTQKYLDQGRILNPGVTDALEAAEIKAKVLNEQLGVKAVSSAGLFTQAMNAVKAMAFNFMQGPNGIGIDPETLQIIGQTADATARLKNNTPVTIVAPGEKERVLDLQTLDAKLVERKTLTDAITQATITLNAAQAAGDRQGIADANTVIADKKKELDAINKPEADPAARALAEERKKIAAENLRVEQQGLADEAEMDRSYTETSIALARDELAQKKQILDQEFAAHTVTAQKKYDETVAEIKKVHDLEVQALQDDIGNDSTSLVNKTKDANQIILLNAQMNTEIAASARQLTSDLKTENDRRYQSYAAMDQEILRTEDSLVSGIFSGNQTLTQALQNMSIRLLESEISDDLKALTERELVNAGMLASDKATAEQGMLFKLFTYLTDTGKQAAAATTKVAANTAANAEIITSDAAAATAKTLATSVANTAAAEANAAVAATGAAASQAAIPIIGPELALAAAAAMMTSMQPFVGLASLDSGTNFVPNDMMAMVHQGERIIPAAQNTQLMAALNGGSAGGGDIHLHLNVSAVDGQSVARMFNNNGGALMKTIGQQIRNANPALRNVMSP